MMQAKFLALLLMVSIKEWSVSASKFYYRKCVLLLVLLISKQCSCYSMRSVQYFYTLSIMIQVVLSP